MFRYWIKILKLNGQSLIKRIYVMLKYDADNGDTYNKQNWAFQIKHQLNNLGLTNL